MEINEKCNSQMNKERIYLQFNTLEKQLSAGPSSPFNFTEEKERLELDCQSLQERLKTLEEQILRTLNGQ